LRLKLPIKLILLLLTIVTPNFCHAEYVRNYDDDLAILSIKDPKTAIDKLEKILLNAEINSDTDKQLLALYYLAESYSILSNQEQTDYIVEKGLILAREQNNIPYISEFLGFKANQLDIKGQYREANKLANQALILSKETDDDRLIAVMHALRGQIHLSLEDYKSSIDDIELAISVFKENNDRERIGIYYNLLALVYSALDDVENSIKFLKESNDYDDTNSPYNSSVFHYNIGLSYLQKKDYDMAIDHLDQAMKISKEIEDESTVAFINYGLAEVHLRKNEYEKAEQRLLESLKWFETSGDLLMHFNNNLLMADLKTQNKLYEEAQLYLDYAETQLITLETPNNRLMFFVSKINFLVSQNKWEEAYNLTKKRDEIKAELIRKEKEISLNEMKIRFNSQFDQDKLIFLQKENELQQKSILEEKTRRYYLWGLMALSLVVFLITYYAYRNQRKIKRHLYHLTKTDDLTQIANRRHIIEKLTYYHELSIQNSSSLGVIMIDLDHFKRVNDTYGHAKGNDVLIHFANCAKNLLKDKGCVGRLGGEEWLLVLPDLDLTEIQSLLQFLRQEFNTPEKLHLPKEHNLSFSSGVLICKGQCESVDKMLKIVDDSLYQAKDNGRNQDIYVLK
jgi:diguanylate cyclase (GGDEF)-like protein